MKMVKNIYSSYIKNPFTPKKNNILGVIIHNDAGAMTPSQYLTWLTNRVKNGQAELGFAALYINRHEALWFSPTDHAEWHAGNQYGNYNFIGFEVAESMPSKTSNATFLENEEATLKVAADVMKSYNLTPNRDTVRLHNEFTSTACPHRSWSIHLGNVPYTQANKNKLKDYFIGRIKYYMGSATTTAPTPSQPTVTKPKTASKKSTATIVNEVIAGKWGSGNDRFNRLNKAGYNAQAIQNAVNKKLGAKTVAKPKSTPKKKSISTIAQEVIDGKWGNGATRKTRLQNAGYNANSVQAEVNRRLGAGNKSTPSKKSVDAVARDIINGKGGWGTGNTRFNRLRSAGYDADAVQRRINQLL